jgi:hypothetical protein
MKQIVAILCLCLSASAISAEVIVHGLFCTEDRCWINSDKPVWYIKTGDISLIGKECLLNPQDFFFYDRVCTWEGELHGIGGGASKLKAGGSDISNVLRVERILLLLSITIILGSIGLLIKRKANKDEDRFHIYYRGYGENPKKNFSLIKTVFVWSLIYHGLTLFNSGVFELEAWIPLFSVSVVFVATMLFDHLNYKGTHNYTVNDYWRRTTVYSLLILGSLWFL